MNQNSNFPKFGQQRPQQYGLNSYDAPARKAGIATRIFGERIGQKFSSPLFATGALLLSGVVFAMIIMAAYPDGENTDIPTLRADQFAYKEIPGDAGGVDIPNRDTTIFSAMNDDPQAARIENLFEDEAPDEGMDKLAAFAREAKEQGITADSQSVDDEGTIADVTTMANVSADGDMNPGMTDNATVPTTSEPVTLQKIETPREPETTTLASAESPAASKSTTERPTMAYKAGENPETLDFVRSVLDKKDAATANTPPVVERNDVYVASVQPAAGNAKADYNVTSGNYYIQLGSVKSMSGAEGEWGKLKKTFSSELGELSHRVTTADLGERGTYYRIQAGPISKDSATRLCDAIKAQKPGGCLITQ